jgi:GTP-binding protein
MAVCDVPGLIEGAHENAGLGHKFLRHIERCKVLVLVVDMAGTDGRNPYEDYKQLLAELKLYDPGLLEKPRLLAANKMDEPVAAANLRKFKRQARKIRIIPMAAAFDQGIKPFKAAIRGMHVKF